MSDIDKIKKLRQSTGAGFKDCNLALKESSGDLEKAVEILRVKGIAKATKKMSRNASEGVIILSSDKNKSSLSPSSKKDYSKVPKHTLEIIEEAEEAK